MIAAAAVLLLYRFSFSVPGYEGRHFRHWKLESSHLSYLRAEPLKSTLDISHECG